MATDAKNLKICRVPTASDDAFIASTPAKGSIYFREKTSQIVVGDGATAGGVPFVPTSGGTMTGSLNFQQNYVSWGNAYITQFDNTLYVNAGSIQINHDTSLNSEGSQLEFEESGKENVVLDRRENLFRIFAKSSGNSVQFNPANGSFILNDGYSAESIASSDSNHAAFGNGLLVCWGQMTTDSSYIGSDTFHHAFTGTPHVVATALGDTNGSYTVMLRSVTTTGVTCLINLQNVYQAGIGCNWIAVGRWK